MSPLPWENDDYVKFVRADAAKPAPAHCRHCKDGSGTVPAEDGRGLRSCPCCKGTGEQPDFTGAKPAPAPPEDFTCSLCGAGPFEAVGLVDHAKIFHAPAPPPEEPQGRALGLLDRILRCDSPGRLVEKEFAVQELRFHITDLTRRLAEVEAVAESRLREVGEGNEVLMLAEHNREAAEARVVELERQLESANLRISSCIRSETAARDQRDAAQASYESAMAVLNATAQERDKLRTKLADTRALYDAKRKECHEAQAVADRRGKKIQRTAENLCATRKKLSKVEAEREAHRATVARIVEWAKGNCMMCEKVCRTPSGHEILARDDCTEWQAPRDWGLPCR